MRSAGQLPRRPLPRERRATPDAPMVFPGPRNLELVGGYVTPASGSTPPPRIPPIHKRNAARNLSRRGLNPSRRTAVTELPVVTISSTTKTVLSFPIRAPLGPLAHAWPFAVLRTNEPFLAAHGRLRRQLSGPSEAHTPLKGIQSISHRSNASISSRHPVSASNRRPPPQQSGGICGGGGGVYGPSGASPIRRAGCGGGSQTTGAASDSGRSVRSDGFVRG